ncbi:hypothetical protein [Candidatus Harpocratesius sp.]
MKRKSFFYQNVLILLLLISIFSPMIKVNGYTESNTRKLDFTILFHANQANVPYSVFANEVCYEPVLNTLLEHPNIPFPLHFSGTLLTDLAFYSPHTLDLLRLGLNNGQFEMIGSTYSQNIIYSLEYNYDESIQIEKHLETINKTLNVKPVGFWNPERCWRHSQYVPLLSEHGYTYTFLEDQIIAQATNINEYSEYKIRKAIYNDTSILIIDDDKSIINYVDAVGQTTESPTDSSVVQAVDNLISFLYDIYENDTNDDYLVFYGQDMEAWGLWQEEGSFGLNDNYENVMARLDYLLSRLEAESDWLQLTTPSQFIANLPEDYNFEELTSIPDGQAHWMQQPCQDQGYVDWFDFNANDIDLKEFRSEFSKVRNRLMFIQSAIDEAKNEEKKKSAERLMSYAEFVFVANQFEFGCVGVKPDWFYRAKSALLTAEAAYYALNPSLSLIIEEEDLDLDGISEYILKDSSNYVVISPNGARLLNWYNISSGIIYTANDVPNTYVKKIGTRYRSINSLSAPIEPIAPGDQWGRNDQTFIIRPNTFYDSFENGENSFIWQNIYYTPTLFENSIAFNVEYSNRVISKIFSLDQNNGQLIVSYTYQNYDTDAYKPKIGFTISPSNEEILFSGLKGINYTEINENSIRKYCVLNTIDNVGVEIQIQDGNDLNFTKDKIDPMFAFGFHLSLPSIGPDQTYQIVISLKGIQSIQINDQNNISDDAYSDENSKGLTNLIPGYRSLMFPSFAFIAIVILIVKQKSEI